MAKGSQDPCWLPRLSEVPPESLLEDVNAVTIPTAAITETNKLIYSTAIRILEMLGYKFESSHKDKYPPWRWRLKVKIKATEREVSQI